MVASLSLFMTIGAGLFGAQGSHQLAALEKLAASDDPNRVLALVSYLEQAPQEESLIAEKLLLRTFEAIHKELSAIFSERHREGVSESEKRELDTRYAVIERQYCNQEQLQSLTWQGNDGPYFQFVRDLYVAVPSNRIMQIRKLAKAVRSDRWLPEDMVWFGPSCGTYDHSAEHRLAWAAQRYPKECITALSVGEWDGRRNLMVALQARGSVSPVPEDLVSSYRPLLIRLAANPNPLVRGEALISLGTYAGSEIEELVKASLRHRHADTRAKALVVAKQRKLRDTWPIVLEMTRGEDNEVMDLAVDALGSFSVPEGNRRLVVMLEESEGKRTSALEAIDDYRIEAAIPTLRLAYDSPKCEWRESALRILTTLLPEERESLALQALSDPSTSVVQRAIWIVSEFKIRSALGKLSTLLAHADEDLRESAASAIKDLHQPNDINQQTGSLGRLANSP